MYKQSFHSNKRWKDGRKIFRNNKIRVNIYFFTKTNTEEMFFGDNNGIRDQFYIGKRDTGWLF